jgi:hypothetical protein
MHLDVSGSDAAGFTSTHNSGYQIVESGVAYNTSVGAGGAEYAVASGADVLADDHQGGAFVKFV